MFNRSDQFVSNSISSFDSSRSHNTNTTTSNDLRFESMSINSQDLSANTRHQLNKQHIGNSHHGPTMFAEHALPTFNWLPLTAMDRQFLKTAETSLRSNDPKKIKNYCTFLQTIVFSDFPAEIFLQRSLILKVSLIFWELRLLVAQS